MSAMDSDRLHYRHDHYQTADTVIASLFLKKIDKTRSHVRFVSPRTISVDLHTADNRQYVTEIPLFGTIDADKSAFKIMNTKLELTLVKLDHQSWPTLRADEQRPDQIIQVGQAARA